MIHNAHEETKDQATEPAQKIEILKFVRNYGTPLSILLGALIIAGAIYASNGGMRTGFAKSKSPSPTAANPEAAPRIAGSAVDVSPDDDPSLGNPNAPVTIIEFSDFQCPFCRKLWRESLPQIKAKYVDTGKVKFVYRDFPLDIHPSAQITAEAGECAHEQGEFWPYHDKIFQEQDKQGEGTIRYTEDDLKKWAGEIGLNTKQFNDCLDSGKYTEEVEKDLQDGIAAGVTGTPGSFVNNQQIRGAVPYEEFEKLIEAQLKK